MIVLYSIKETPMATTASPTEERKARIKTVAKVKARLTHTVGEMIDSMRALRDEKRALEAQIAEVELKYKGIEEILTAQMKTQGLESASGKKATASLGAPMVYASVEDWDAFMNFIMDNRYGHLLQHRVSEPAYRELRELGQTVPGAVDFVKQRMNLRNL